MNLGRLLSRAYADLVISLIFLTRLPLHFSGDIARPRITQAMGAFPLAGGLIGAFTALLFWGAERLLGAPLAAAALAVGLQILLTGAFHEDGLADTADGLGGGQTLDRKLEIMRDSRLGTYGAAALIMTLILRTALIAAIVQMPLILLALVSAGMLSRSAIVAVMHFLPPAAKDGLAAAAGTPSRTVTLIALALGVLPCFLFWPPLHAVILALSTGAAAAVMARLSWRHLQGQTGDILGATQQVTELVLLIAILALKQNPLP